MKIKICDEFYRTPPFELDLNYTSHIRNYFSPNLFDFIKFENADSLDKNYLVLNLVHGHTLEFLSSKPPSFYEYLIQKKFKILFLHEGFDLFSQRGEEFIKNIDFNNIIYWKILSCFLKNNMKEEDLFFIHSAEGYLEEIKRLRLQPVIWHKSTIDIKSKHLELPLYLTWGQNTKVVNELDIRYHFACLFGSRQGHHRHNLLKKLWQMNLLEYGKCSLNKMPDGSMFDKINLVYDGNINLSKQLVNYNETPVFKDIFLWVAGETLIPNEHAQFTEKTIKAILYQRPFISFSKPGILKYLKKFGFKTFSDYWDESYDDVPLNNMDDKISKIANIIKKVCSTDVNKLNEMYEHMLPILLHNKKILQETNCSLNVKNFLS